MFLGNNMELTKRVKMIYYEFFDDITLVFEVKIRAAAYTLMSGFTGFITSPRKLVRASAFAVSALVVFFLTFAPQGADSMPVSGTANANAAVMPDSAGAGIAKSAALTGFYYGDISASMLFTESNISDTPLPLAGSAGIEDTLMIETIVSPVSINEYEDETGVSSARDASSEIRVGPLSVGANTSVDSLAAPPPGALSSGSADPVPQDRAAWQESVDNFINLYEEISGDLNQDLSATDSGFDVDYMPGRLTERVFNASTGSYIWPTYGSLSSGFGSRSIRIGSSNHKGIDIGGSNNQPIYAADSGDVIFSGWSDSYGNYIRIQHDDGSETVYAHCSSLRARVGERVVQGQDIARMGSTGIATGVHLHFELIINGTQVDPLPYLP